MEWVGAMLFAFAICVLPCGKGCQGRVCAVFAGELEKESSDSASSDTSRRSKDSDFTATIIGEKCIAELKEGRGKKRRIK